MSHTALCALRSELCSVKFKQLLRLLGDAQRKSNKAAEAGRGFRPRALWPGGAAPIASTPQQGTFNINPLELREAL